MAQKPTPNNMDYPDPGRGSILLPDAEKSIFGAALSTFQDSIAMSISDAFPEPIISYAGQGYNYRTKLLATFHQKQQQHQHQHHPGQQNPQPCRSSATLELPRARTGTVPRPFNPLRPYQSVAAARYILPVQGDDTCALRAHTNHTEHARSPASLVIPEAPDPFLFLSDFHPRYEKTTCCNKYICAGCFGSSLINNIQWGWWCDIGQDGSKAAWLKCPACGSALSSLYSKDYNVLQLLKTLDMPDASFHVMQYQYAAGIRSALIHGPHSSSPYWVRHDELLKTSICMHHVLAEKGLIHPFFGSKGEKPLPRFQVIFRPVYIPGLEDPVETIPVFSHLFQPRVPRDCTICVETYYEYNDPDEDRWAEAFKSLGYALDVPGRFQSINFPTKDLFPGCKHELNICRDCIARHIKVELDNHGVGCVRKIKCMDLDCTYTFSNDDIAKFAKPDVVAKYKRLSTYNDLSPHDKTWFRWCLGPGCESGEVYDCKVVLSEFSHNKNMVRCGNCSFAMCFRHQVPWHHGTTCTEVDKAMEEPDRKTKAWLKANTKPCPNPSCGISIVKGDGCWHMTCKVCKFEFCWECLADWKAIKTRRRDGHKDGCFFKLPGAVAPEVILGQNRAQAREDVERTRNLPFALALELLDRI